MTPPGNEPYGAASYDLGPVRLTPVTAEDADALGAGLATIDPWRRMGYAAGTLSGYLTRPDPAARRFAIRANGTLAGAISVRDPWLRGPYLELLGLLTHAQGQGAGRAAMDWFEAEAPPGAGNLWVACSAFNTGALAFYKRHGFVEAAALEDLVFTGFAEILLRKPLRRKD
jgi:ribosomal protein S18 acetylase RimI-like enzyme